MIRSLSPFILLVPLLLLPTAWGFAQEPAEGARVGLSYETVERSESGGVLHLVVDVVATNLTQQPLSDVEAEALLLGDLPGNVQLDNVASVAPSTLSFGDLGPRERATYPGVEISFNYMMQEPRVVWSVRFFDEAGAEHVQHVR